MHSEPNEISEDNRKRKRGGVMALKYCCVFEPVSTVQPEACLDPFATIHLRSEIFIPPVSSESRQEADSQALTFD
ncbi:hypothetical protein R3I93_019285 [Phoxinus phoxinus]|uniref:Uncharacterized protein n=1 Tax=Phoxinus phoxinus TaxID=58324 RepID=A0AAN9GTT2_9TELE